MRSLVWWRKRLVIGGVLVVGSVILWTSVSDLIERQAWDRFAEGRAADAPTSIADLGVMPDALVESSGLAVSRAYPGVLWSHNDSGDQPRIYAMDTTATLGGVFQVTGAEAIDWESMDIGPCLSPEGLREPEGEGWCIYAADTGDNNRRRESVTVYVIPEPEPVAAGGEVATLGAIRFRYPDGPFDTEAFAVTSEGELVIVTKGRSPDIWLFRMSAAEAMTTMESGEVFQLSGGVRLPIDSDAQVGRTATGAALSSDETVLAVRTYSEIYFFAWPLGPRPELFAPPCFLGAYEPQGEAVAFWSGGRILLASESRSEKSGHLLAITCAGVAAAGPY